MLPKLPIITKNASNMLFGIKFPTKRSVGAYVYLPGSGASVLERLPCLKYYNVLEL